MYIHTYLLTLPYLILHYITLHYITYTHTHKYIYIVSIFAHMSNPMNQRTTQVGRFQEDFRQAKFNMLGKSRSATNLEICHLIRPDTR